MNADRRAQAVRKIAEDLRKWWSFDDRGHPTHSLRAREAFISKVLLIRLRTTPRATKAGFVIEPAERCRT